MTDQQQQTAPPTNAAEAATRLAALSADKTWSTNLLAGDVAAAKEFADLTTLVASGDPVEQAMAGLIPRDGLPSSDVVLMAKTTEMLRDFGIRDEVIQQTLTGQEITQAEHDAAKAWKTRISSDPVWVQRYLKGDAECREKMTLADIILSSPIKQGASA